MDPRFTHETERKKALAPVKRWSPKRKAYLVCAIVAGYFSYTEACEAHSVSREELESWWAAYHTGGRLGLRTSATRSFKRGEAA